MSRAVQIGLPGLRQRLIWEVVPLISRGKMRQAAAGRLLEPGVRQPGMGAPLRRRAAGRPGHRTVRETVFSEAVRWCSSS
jgi:hypothetical protein